MGKHYPTGTYPLSYLINPIKTWTRISHNSPEKNNVKWVVEIYLKVTLEYFNNVICEFF
jgi:hypothetical protein